MITQQERERIFALYWGQEVFQIDSYHKRQKVDGYGMLNYLSPEAYLLLTPLHLITDEHAVEVARLFNESDKAISAENLANADAEMVKEQINDMWMITPIADYLRSNGYAIPCFGYSVESLVEQGVFKLREPNKH